MSIMCRGARFILLLVLTTTAAAPEELSSSNIVQHINSGSYTWKASHNHISAMGPKARVLLGARIHKTRDRDLLPPAPEHLDLEAGDIPQSYDVRRQYPECTILGAIKDQSNCGSCWAVSVMSAFSDRWCIAKGPSQQKNMSAQHMAACCDACGYGCEGGDPFRAWDELTKRVKGAVTGGDFGSNEGCQPYEVSPCGGAGRPKCSPDPPQLHCTKDACTNPGYNVTYKNDTVFAKKAWRIPANSVKYMQMEILRNGPIVGVFCVYEDFYYYKSGVYKHTTEYCYGYHAVKILGWGVEAGVPYWLVANSWGRGWGEDGFFKILLGTDECGIESLQVTCGIL